MKSLSNNSPTICPLPPDEGTCNKIAKKKAVWITRKTVTSSVGQDATLLLARGTRGEVALGAMTTKQDAVGG